VFCSVSEIMKVGYVSLIWQTDNVLIQAGSLIEAEPGLLQAGSSNSLKPGAFT